ncbi:MAG TPA: alpha/beta fold hydrolase [Gaiellaceae bacterium]|nr:alpha/beta fold hydrolase [Gaiellaceae bacterium]
MAEERRLATGAALRLTNAPAQKLVLCVNGGQASEVPGTWSPTLEWLVERLAPRFPGLGFGELRYRVKSWRQLGLCVEDARAAIHEAGGERTLLVGFSMGGAVAISAAGEPGVSGVLGLAPWIFDRLDLAPLAGRRLDVLHGSLDRWLPAVPGVRASLSRRGFERAQARGVPGSYTLIRGGLHGLALRGPGGLLVPLPRAATWARLIEAQLGRFAD